MPTKFATNCLGILNQFHNYHCSAGDTHSLYYCSCRGGDLHLPEVPGQKIPGEQAPAFAQETHAVFLAFFHWDNGIVGSLLIPELCGGGEVIRSELGEV